MAFQFHPLAFGVMVVVAIGTVAFTLWNTRPQPQRHYEYPQQDLEPPKKPIPRKKRKDDTCTICLGDLNVGVRTLECGHAFHFACIKKWLRYGSNCPNCRNGATS